MLPRAGRALARRGSQRRAAGSETLWAMADRPGRRRGAPGAAERARLTFEETLQRLGSPGRSPRWRTATGPISFPTQAEILVSRAREMAAALAAAGVRPDPRRDDEHRPRGRGRRARGGGDGAAGRRRRGDGRRRAPPLRRAGRGRRARAPRASRAARRPRRQLRRRRASLGADLAPPPRGRRRRPARRLREHGTRLDEATRALHRARRPPDAYAALAAEWLAGGGVALARRAAAATTVGRTPRAPSAPLVDGLRESNPGSSSAGASGR